MFFYCKKDVNRVKNHCHTLIHCNIIYIINELIKVKERERGRDEISCGERGERVVLTAANASS